MNVQLKIEHKDPLFRYSGSVQRNQESSPDTFEFEGAIDGKSYPVNENNNEAVRTIQFTRKSARAIESWSSGDRMEEHAVTTLAPDGKTLTRRMRVKPKAGIVRNWIEAYEKKN